MFHEESVVNGVLCWRNSPDGNWIEYSPKELTGIISDYKNRFTELTTTIRTNLYGIRKAD